MGNQNDFLAKYRPAAEKIAAETGIPVERILAQAGHETGWNADTPGNNFFGIKAQPGYQGNHQTLDTTEDYGNGLQKVKQRFRAYDNPEDSFRDWANLIQSDRYKAAMQPGLSDADFAGALKAGGYATDPNYAPKLTNVIASTRAALGMPEGTQVAMRPSAAVGVMQQNDQSPTRDLQPAATTAIPTAGPPAGQAVAGAQKPFSLDGSARNGLALMAASTPQAAAMPALDIPTLAPRQKQQASLLESVFGKRNPYNLFG